MLFDGGGAQIGPTLVRTGVAVAAGVFTVNLDFEAGFTGATRFLEIRVRQSGGGAFTTLSPRQPVSSAPYSIKSLTANSADNATNAANATNAVNASAANTAGTATNFTGNLAGDVTGTQISTTVVRLQSRTVASTAPLDGQVLKFNSANNRWQPDTDNTGSGGGGGTITGVTPGTGLTGGGTTGNVTVGIGPGGVGTGQLAEGSVVDSKIVTVSGAKVTGTVANATNATTATNATQLGGIAASSYLQTNGNGSGLTNLNASSITTGTLSNARLGQIPTANIADSAVTSGKIAVGQVVKTLNGLTDNVTLAAGSNISITPSGNTLTIASTGGGGNSINNQTTTQAGANFNIDGVGTATTFNAMAQYNINGLGRILSSPGSNNLFAGIDAGAVNTSGSGNSFVGFAAGKANTSGSSNSYFGGGAGFVNSTGLNNSFVGTNSGNQNTQGNGNTFVGSQSGTTNTTGGSNTLIGFAANVGSSNLTNATAIGQNAIVSQSNSLVLGSNFGSGTNVGIGTSTPTARLDVTSSASPTTTAIRGVSPGGTGVYGEGLSYGAGGTSVTGTGVRGDSTSGIGVWGNSISGAGVYAVGASQGTAALQTQGSSWFAGNTTPFNATNMGSGTGIAIGSVPGAGFIYGFDHGANAPRDLAINTPGGRVGIGTFNPDQTLSVNGNASKPGGGSWATFSDERLKHIKGHFNGGLKAVMKLQPLRYEYKKDNLAGVKSDGEHIGFSAQEVEKVIPEAVTKTEQGIRLVNNDPIILAMLNAIKEQQAVIVKLTKQVRQLQKRDSARSTKVRR